MPPRARRFIATLGVIGFLDDFAKIRHKANLGLTALQKFMSNPGLVFTREQLLSSIWGTDFIGETRTVDVHIGTLRTKLGPCGGCIETIRGVGYRLGSKN